MGFHVYAGDDLGTFEHGEDVVAVLALGFGHEDLDPVVEAEQALGAVAVA